MYDSESAYAALHRGGQNKTSSMPHKSGQGYNQQYDDIGYLPFHSPKFTFFSSCLSKVSGYITEHILYEIYQTAIGLQLPTHETPKQ